MEVTQDLSFIHLIGNASLLVQLVMGLLLLVSLMSWWYIFLKLFAIRREVRLTGEFEEAFWHNQNLNELYKQASGGAQRDQGALERIFSAGFVEFVKLRKQHGVDAAAVMEGTRRAMRATYQREMDRLESHLAFLASVGSVSPYVGLFGTVWGIMNAFRGLANVGRRRWRMSRRASPRRWWRPRWACSQRFRRWLPTTATRMTSIVWPRVFESFTEEFSNVLQRQPLASHENK